MSNLINDGTSVLAAPKPAKAKAKPAPEPDPVVEPSADEVLEDAANDDED